MPLRVAWFVNETPIQPDASGQLTSDNIQVRQRCLLPARALENAETECSVFGNMVDPDLTHVSHMLQKLRTQIVILRPFTGPSGLPLMRTAKHLGCYVVLDLGDGSITPPQIDQMISLADYVVISNTAAPKPECQKMCVIPDYPTDSLEHAEAVQAWRNLFTTLLKTSPLCANNNSRDSAHDET